MNFKANGALFIEADDMIVAWCRRTGEGFEPETADWIFGVMAQGGVVIDVGASTGWYAIPLAMHGCEVHAIEPHPLVRQRLYDNIALNGTFLRVYPAAASAKNGEMVIHFNASLPLTSGASLERDACLHPTGRIRVSTITIDSLDLRPTLIKIDVEGHELPVLRGAEATIARHRPYLMLEANTAVQRERLLEWLEGARYESRPADGRNLLCTPIG